MNALLLVLFAQVSVVTVFPHCDRLTNGKLVVKAGVTYRCEGTTGSWYKVGR